MKSVSLISVTEKAKSKIIETIKSCGRSVAGIRMSLKTKGCSGLSWELEISDYYNGFDDQVEIGQGLIIFIDKKATLFILGTELDYLETELESGFIFNNPKEKGKCGCGESFYV